MKDITIIIPIHKLDDETEKLLKKSVESVKLNREYYKNGELKVLYVVSEDVSKEKIENLIDNSTILVNDGKTDFCSQINFAVDHVDTEFFSILEFDDEYNKKWFKMANEYHLSNEDVSVFLPINVQFDQEMTHWAYGNEMVLASSFSNEIGMIDFECLENCFTFNLTGGIFNTEDFKNVGKFKPSIKVAFNYEFLLRATNKTLKVMVVPKEGYKHMIARKGSLTEEYNKELDNEEMGKYFELAKKEYEYTEDRNKKISKNAKTEVLK